jgi:hypothetical protein
MPAPRVQCPACSTMVTAPLHSATVLCPQCKVRFTASTVQARVPVAAAAVPAGPPLPGKLVGPAVQPRPLRALTPLPPTAPEKPSSLTRTVLTVAAVLALALLGLGSALAITMAVIHHKPPAENPSAAPGIASSTEPGSTEPKPPEGPPVSAPPPAASRPNPDNPLAGYVPRRPGEEPLPPPPSEPKTPADPGWAGNLSEAEQQRVQQAIDRGVKYLKGRVLERSDQWLQRPGGMALAGLTLLVCGVPADDPAVKKALEHIRRDGAGLKGTYDLALAILFLDRLNDPHDLGLMQTMTLRLAAGQNESGGWTYVCPELEAREAQQLLSYLESVAPPEPLNVTIEGDRPRSPDRPPTLMQGRPDGNLDKLPEGIKKLPVVQFQPGKKIEPRASAQSDNSNTQFAVLAVWAARKHGLPVDRNLAMVEARFQASQHDDGSWSYNNNPKGPAHWPDSMTCAGLLGLGVGRGIIHKEDAKKLGRDARIDKGLDFLARGIGRQPGDQRERRGSGHLIHADAHGDLYYLWSVERVAVMYDLATINGKDWYGWGAQLLVDDQNNDGSWADAFAGVPDTCFALLFLKRANVAQDLTARLKMSNLLDTNDGGKPK